MFYRVLAEIFFSDPDEADDFYHDCELALPKGTTINPHLVNEEKSFIQLQSNYHDEVPPKGCNILKEAKSD